MHSTHGLWTSTVYLGTAVTVRGADNGQWDNTEYFLLRKSGLPVWCPGRNILRKFIVKELNATPMVFIAISNMFLACGTYKKCSPEWISCEDHERKFFGEKDEIKCQYNPKAHNDQRKKNLDSLEGENKHEVTRAQASGCTSPQYKHLMSPSC